MLCVDQLCLGKRMGSLNNIQLDLDKLPNLAVDRNKLRRLAPAVL